MSRLPRSFLRPVGGAVRDLRLQRGLTLEGLARATGLSKGLLSKIENFRAVPSLPVLGTIARALDVDLDRLVADVQVRPRHPYLLVRAGKGAPVRREDSRGFRYAALQAAECGGVQVQAFQLTIEPGVTREPRTTDGDEWLVVQRGAVDFILDEEQLRLATGDSLYFDGRVPHAPRNPGAVAAQLLVLYLIPSTPRQGT
jgi:transcriptional regulator with XRE-family HTH domain